MTARVRVTAPPEVREYVKTFAELGFAVYGTGGPVRRHRGDRSTHWGEASAVGPASIRHDLARSGEELAERTVHWWRRACPGLTRAGYPPVALVVTDAGPVGLANRQQAVVDLSADRRRGS